MVTRLAFSLLCGLVGLQRLQELRASKHNEARLFESGGHEHAAGHFRCMSALHAGWLAASCAEVWLLDRPFAPSLGLPMAVLFGAGQLLRRSARRALGWRWSVRIVTVPGLPAVSNGPYRYLRHPNYLGVALEIAALPLIHGAWLSAVSFSLANALLLAVRVRHEEAALLRDSDYGARFDTRPRFLPRWEAQ